MPHCSTQQTTAEPTAEQETTQKPTVCFTNTLVEDLQQAQLYIILNLDTPTPPKA